MPKTSCDFCGKEISESKVISATGQGATVKACTWRHLWRRLTHLFTTGAQVEAGLENQKPTEG